MIEAIGYLAKIREDLETIEQINDDSLTNWLVHRVQ